MNPKVKTKKTDFYECKRCEITSDTKGRMCPCPRGSCEAAIIGTKIVQTSTLLLPLNAEQKKWNKDNYR